MIHHIAKNIVVNEYADKYETQVICNRYERAIIYIHKYIWNKKSNEELVNLIREKFDLTSNGIIKYLMLKDPIYTKTTNVVHFEKEELNCEKVIKI